MGTLPDSEVRKMYSWWWDSHNSPKNSKWLQENLADMDSKIEAMIRLIEEDADSFARRAELFYKRRPELMKLLEQFYRAYRALAERYDHAAGALRQAHRTMAEAFPNQFHIDFNDEMPTGSCAADTADQSDSDASREFFDPDSLVNGLLDAMNSNDDNLKKLSSMSGQEEDGNNLQLSNEIEDLRNQILLEMERANKAETEIQCLKETIFTVKTEKEDALTRHQESAERVSVLEKGLVDKQEDLNKINEKVFKVVSQLHSTEEQKLLLSKANQSLESELDILKHRTIEQKEEIEKRIEEMEKLHNDLQEEQQWRRSAEVACQSLRKQCTECEEQLRLLTLKLQDAIEKIKEVEQMNVNLKQELWKIREENDRLQEEKLSSIMKIINLQDEVISLTNLTCKLEDEIGNNERQKKDLQLEISHLKQDRNNIEQKYRILTEEIKTVNTNIEMLQAMIRDLSGQSFELKESFKIHENEKLVHLQNQRHIGTNSEDNETIEASLGKTNNELERLKQKVKDLEKSCCHLHSKVCTNEAEKVALVSQAENATQNMDYLSKKNTCLEDSLSSMNDELNTLRKKLKGLEESYNSLHDQKSILVSEKNTLITKVNNLTRSLKNLEKTYAELEDKYSNLEITERESMLYQMTELEELLRQQKNEHSSLVKSSKHQLNKFEKTIRQMQETDKKKEGDLESVQHKLMNAHIENFILQRCIHDMKDQNSKLSVDCYKQREFLSSTQKACAVQEKNIQSLTDNNENLRGWIRKILQLLKINLEFVNSSEVQDELLVQLVLREIEHLQLTISEVQDEKQHLLLEKSIILTLLKQYGVSITDLRAEKDAATKSKSNVEELTLIQNKHSEIFEVNEKLKEEVKTCKEREEQLKSEVDILFGQLTDMQESHRVLQIKTSKLHEENRCMHRKFQDMKARKDKLEAENKTIVEEIMALDCLSVICSSVSSERGLELQIISNERDYLANVKTELEKKIQLVTEKLVTLEVENKRMKESVLNLDECRRNLLHAQDDLNIAKSVCEQLNLQIFAGKNNLSNEKDRASLQVNSNAQKSQDMTSDLSRLPKIKLGRNEAEVMRGVKDKKLSATTEDYACKDNEASSVNQANIAFRGKHSRSQKHAEDQRTRETNSMSIVQKGSNEVRPSGAETASLFSDVQLVATNAALFKEKVLELIKACQSFDIAMVHRKALDGDMSRNLTVVELKEKLDALEGENRILRIDLNTHLRLLGSLWDDVSVLEEHTFSLAKRRSLSRNVENQVKSFRHMKENQETSADHSELGLSKLQDVHAKVKLLQKVVIDTENLLARERLDSSASLEAAWKEIEGLKSKGTSDNEANKVHEERMKDIQLDIVLNPSRYGNGKMTGNDKNAELKLELWGKAEGVYSNQRQKSPTVTDENDTDQHYQLKEVKKGKLPMSELMVEKELSIDKLELPQKVDSYQDRGIVKDRLSTDSQRLIVLQYSIQELQKNIEASKRFDYPPRLELDTVKVQLKDAGDTVTKLISVHSKLAKKLQDLAPSLDNDNKDNTDKQSRNQKLVSERAQKLSEKIARLELELQKFQQTVLKVNEEQADKRTKVAERRTGILLREYIYGRRDSRRQKKGCGCGCMRPRTKGD